MLVDVIGNEVCSHSTLLFVLLLLLTFEFTLLAFNMFLLLHVIQSCWIKVFDYTHRLLHDNTIKHLSSCNAHSFDILFFPFQSYYFSIFNTANISADIGALLLP